MPNAQSVRESAAPLNEVFEEAITAARRQVSAAWQLQAERVAAELNSGWERSIDSILSERFAELGPVLEQRTTAARAQARRGLAEKLNLAVRNLSRFENGEQWSRALVDITAGFCKRAAVFSIDQGKLYLYAARGLETQTLSPAPLSSAPAFATVAESKDAVVALRTRGELSQSIVNLVGEAPEARFHLFPLIAGGKVAAILYADADDATIEPAALETIAAYGSAILGSVAATRPRLGPLFGKRAESWDALSPNEQKLHLRAQRFARVRVANMRLYKAQAVKTGRAERGLYAHLKVDIDEGREAFRQTFLTGSNSMADYFHLELVRTLADENPDLLGPDYPGPAV